MLNSNKAASAPGMRGRTAVRAGTVHCTWGQAAYMAWGPEMK